MKRTISSRRRTFVPLAMVAATTLVMVAVTGPVDASAATPRPATASTALTRQLAQAAHAWKARTSTAHAVGAHDDAVVPCTFNGQTSLVSNLTPGGSITVICTGFSANDSVVLGETSPLDLAVDDAQSVNEIDVNDVDTATANGSGDLTTTFTLPHPFVAPDPAAACPPTQIQQNSGLGDCLLVVTDGDLNGNVAALSYAGQASPEPAGYQEVASDGGIFAFGSPFYGSEGGKPLDAPIVGAAFDPDTGGYWEVASDGGIFAFNAPFDGSMGGKPLTKPIVGMAFDPNTGGYWEVASDGGIFSFGGAPFEGSMGGQVLTKPIVGMAADPFTGGYWEVASDGGIFAFNAPYDGSEGGQALAKPVVGMALDTDSGGYWEVASDGGIFSFGGAAFQGSMGGKPLDQPIVGMATDPLTGGYWEVASDGGLFSFNAPFQGSEGGKPLDKPVVTMVPAVEQ